MSVFVDDMLMEADVPNGARTVSGRWSHLTADTEGELHDFACGKLGMKRAWFQPQEYLPDNEHNRARGQVGKPKGRFHYDVVASKRSLAIKLGAIPLRMGCAAWMDLYSPGWREEGRLTKAVEARTKEPDVNPANELDDVFGPPARPDGVRYAARPPHRVWDVREMFVLLPPLLACESDRAYVKTVVFLCETLGRVPLFAGGVRPTSEQYVRECVALIERRTVTEFLAENRELLQFAWAMPTPRTGVPLSWAEKVKFLQPYAHNRNQQSRVPVGILPLLLARNLAFDAKMVGEYTASVAAKPRPEPEDHDAPYPADQAHRDAAAAKIQAFLNAAPDELAPAWASLHTLE